MHVGDRTGTIFKLMASVKNERGRSSSRQSQHFISRLVLTIRCTSLANSDELRFDLAYQSGRRSRHVLQRLGRPQGLAFDREGNLYVAAALRGRRGIVRISRDGSEAKLVVAGINLVGLAFSSAGEMAVVSIDSVYSVPAQIKGTLLP
jgi:sugar lactone lactonase YvrE